MQFRIAGTGTLHPDDFLGHLAIGWPADLTAGRAIGPEHLLELQAVDHVRVAAAAVFTQPALVVQVVAGGDNDGADVKGVGHRFCCQLACSTLTTKLPT